MDEQPVSDSQLVKILEKAHQDYADGINPRVELSDLQVNYLAGKARLGNLEAREAVVLWGSRLIAPHPAHIQWIKYASVGPEDMWQEGRIAIMTAIEKYDITRGHDFGAYCSRIVANTLGEWAERHSLVISVPRHARRRLRREGVVDETTRLAKAAEQLPRYLSSLLNTSDDQQSISDDLGSLLANRTDEGSPENELVRSEQESAVQTAFFALDPLEQQILYYRFVIIMTPEKAHRLLKIGLATFHALEDEALTHLAEGLHDYLGEAVLS
jgi:RNA polymerase sigma factor (sigma-70 family)